MEKLPFWKGLLSQPAEPPGFGLFCGFGLLENWNFRVGPGLTARKALVYSPHAYGHSVFVQDYFNDPTFPANMPGIWDIHFGHLYAAGYTVAVGEFGGTYQGDDAVWQDAFVDYQIHRGAAGFFYWCLNPNSGDTGGILASDWITPVQPKIDLLQRLMDGIRINP